MPINMYFPIPVPRDSNSAGLGTCMLINSLSVANADGSGNNTRLELGAAAAEVVQLDVPSMYQTWL